jgi:hypothetical protein
MHTYNCNYRTDELPCDYYHEQELNEFELGIIHDNKCDINKRWPKGNNKRWPKYSGLRIGESYWMHEDISSDLKYDECMDMWSMYIPAVDDNVVNNPDDNRVINNNNNIVINLEDNRVIHKKNKNKHKHKYNNNNNKFCFKKQKKW